MALLNVSYAGTHTDLLHPLRILDWSTNFPKEAVCCYYEEHGKEAYSLDESERFRILCLARSSQFMKICEH
jgi:hypothetical protein